MPLRATCRKLRATYKKRHSGNPRLSLLKTERGPPLKITIQSKYANLRDGLRKNGAESVWSNDASTLFIYVEGDNWVLANGNIETATQVFSTAPIVDDGTDPTTATWGAEVDKIIEVWWPEKYHDQDSMWKDPDFPPGDKALGPKHGGVSVPVEWILIRDIDRDASNDVLFEGIDPNDLMQGSLGDCWLMAAISAVAKFPSLIEALFPSGKLPLRKDGRHEVILYDVSKSEWEKIIVDEYIPCEPRKWFECDAKPLFSKPVGCEMWVLLLEKAFAKHVGGYHNLKGGRPVYAWQALTGVKEQRVISRQSPNQWDEFEVDLEEQLENMKRGDLRSLPLGRDEDGPSYNTNTLFKKLLKMDEDHVMAALIDENETTDFSLPNGLFPEHAYAVLQLRTCKGFNFIQLRNPHGHGIEWNGKWSDGDAAWREQPEIAAELGAVDADDGAFWMAFEDFVKEFDTISYCPDKITEAFADSLVRHASERFGTSVAPLEVESGVNSEVRSGSCADRCSSCAVL